MRLLNTATLELEEFYDYQIPDYAILSHRWGPVNQEVSYNDYIAGRKWDTDGYAKIRNFARLALENSFVYCWVDTCCIDKSSSSELSEAINSMYDWYQRAQVCYAYLDDFSDVSDLVQSRWCFRGWTLQELIAPIDVVFWNKDWNGMGTRCSLQREIASITGIDRALLQGEKGLDWYSNAQIMSWAAHRTTSRLEDEAYCLLGLFGVNMPLLYGEGGKAFRRLQETIMTRMEDNSLFLWGTEAPKFSDQIDDSSILASSPKEFEGCSDIGRGFSSERILFELTSQGIMVSLHRSYDRDGLDTLLQMAEGHQLTRGEVVPSPIGLTVPLGSYRRSFRKNESGRGYHVKMASYRLQLVLEKGKWRRIGVPSQYSHIFWMDALRYQTIRLFAYTNDYVRIYLHHNHKSQRDYSVRGRCSVHGDIQYVHLQDAALHSAVHELQAPGGAKIGSRNPRSGSEVAVSIDGDLIGLAWLRMVVRTTSSRSCALVVSRTAIRA